MKFCVLASGSKANSTLIITSSTKVLLDCGLSGKECARRLAVIGCSVDDIDAIIVSHGHSDHISGVGVLSRKFKIPVYATRSTGESISRCHQLHYFLPGDNVLIGDLDFQTFSIPHDSVSTVGFRITDGHCALGHVTDCGTVTSLLLGLIGEVDGLVLEFNHDVGLLQECRYPWSVKNRISSNYGHLSNEMAARLLGQLCSSSLEVVVLAHLSQESNTKALALKAARKGLGSRTDVHVVCGTQDAPTEVFKLSKKGVSLAV